MTRPTLTRTVQVLKELHKGARIEATGERGLLRLVDRNGHELRAWQTALKSAATLQADAARRNAIRSNLQ